MNEALQVFSAAAHIGCLGEFNPADRICRTRCALRLRCAVISAERRRHLLLDLLEEPEDLFDL